MEISTLDNIPIFFIIGRPRSGTTMLRTILDAHPNVSIPLEGKVIVFLHFKYGKIENWNNSKLLEFYYDIFTQAKIDYWIINKKQLKEDILKLGPNATFTRLIKLLYLNYVSFFDKREIILIGDKNPGYSYNMKSFKLLLKLFPQSKIIHLTRDYRDHFLSMQKVDFEGNHLSLVCYRWKYSFVQITKLMESRQKNYYFIRYEDLVQNPKEEVSKICDFLKIEYWESMIHYYTIKDKVLAIYPKEEVMKYHSSLFKPISADYVFGWKQKLSQKQIEMADSTVGKSGEIAGYESVLKRDKIWYKIAVLPDILHSKLWLFYKGIYDSIVPNKFKKNRQLMSRLYFKLFKRK